MAFEGYERLTSDVNKHKRQTKITERKSAPYDSLFSSPSALSDITLVVDGRNLQVSKCVLGLASPVFLKMFEGDFKDKTEIPLADKKYEAMVELLLCIYPSTSAAITRTSLDVVLPLADEYGIEFIKRRCEEFVLSQLNHHKDRYRNPPNQELVHFLYLAGKYKLSKRLDECVGKAKYRTYEGKNGIKCLKEFSLMSADSKFRVTSERISQLETPVRGLVINVIKKPVENRIMCLMNPECKCGYGHTYRHEDMNCRKNSEAEVKYVYKQLNDLTLQFNSDPEVKLQQKLINYLSINQCTFKSVQIVRDINIGAYYFMESYSSII